MKLLVAAVLLAVATARPQRATIEAEEQGVDDALPQAGTLRFVFRRSKNGDFRYGFLTGAPIVQDVAGEIKQIGDKFGVVMQGSFYFIAKDEFGNDVPVEVSYVADEGGFKPVSSFIPVAPEDPNREAQEAAYAAAAARGSQ